MLTTLSRIRSATQKPLESNEIIFCRASFAEPDRYRQNANACIIVLMY
jgi:hypothetical protein